MGEDFDPHELLPLRRMAARVGVTGDWLKKQAEAGAIPCLKAGNRWLFRPDVVKAVIFSLAGGGTEEQSADSASGEKLFGDAAFRQGVAEALERVAVMEKADGREGFVVADRGLGVVYRALRLGLKYPETGAQFDALVMLKELLYQAGTKSEGLT